MKKLHISKRIIKTKWLALLLVTLFLIVLGRTVNNLSLTKSATVIGVGIDYAENSFIVTMQSVIVQGSSSESASGVSYVSFTEKAPTIDAAADKIEQKMGLTISLSHCNIVIMSLSALTVNHIRTFEPLIRSMGLPEQALVVSTAVSPEELLSLKVATTLNVPFYLQTALLENTGSDGIVRTTVKDFFAKVTARSRAALLPFIEKMPLEDQPLSPSEEQKDFVKLKTDKTVAVNDKSNAVLDAELSKIAAIYNSKTVFGLLSIKLESGEIINFRVLKKDQKKKINGRSVETEIKLAVQYEEAQNLAQDSLLQSNDPLVMKAAKELEKKLTTELMLCYEFSKEMNIDFLELENFVYQKVGYTLEKDCLNTISFNPKVKIEVKETS